MVRFQSRLKGRNQISFLGLSNFLWLCCKVRLAAELSAGGSVAKFGAEVVNWLRRLERGIGG